MHWRDHFTDLKRLIIWRTPLRSDVRLSANAILLIFITAALAATAFQYIGSTGLGSFSPYGINSVAATVALAGLTVLVFARPDRTPSTLHNLVLVYTVAITIEILGIVVVFAVLKLVPALKSDGSPGLVTNTLLSLTVAGSFAWTTGAARQVFKLAGDVRHPTARAFAFTICLWLTGILLPNWPVFAPQNFDRTTANIWEIAPTIWRRSADDGAKDYAAAAREAQRKAAGLEAQQPRLLDKALRAVEQRDPVKPNIFLLGVAGWADQNVFEHEIKQSVAMLKSHFHIGDRIVQLFNAVDSTARYPLASIQNISFALREIGARMDREKDVLILTMTSHGSRDGFALFFDNIIYRTLDPGTLKQLLDEAGIKNRIVIIAACYSGVFVPALANDDTMVMTAASATRTSFGCASGRRWTYFGDALFDHGLTEEATFAGAFSVARQTIAQWEADKHIIPSDPQISIGEAIAHRFPDLVGNMRQQPSQAPIAGDPKLAASANAN